MTQRNQEKPRDALNIVTEQPTLQSGGPHPQLLSRKPFPTPALFPVPSP